MKSVFKVRDPDQILVTVTFDMTLGEARSVVNHLQSDTRPPPWSALEFARQLGSIVNQGERVLMPEPRHTERPDG